MDDDPNPILKKIADAIGRPMTEAEAVDFACYFIRIGAQTAPARPETVDALAEYLTRQRNVTRGVTH